MGVAINLENWEYISGLKKVITGTKYFSENRKRDKV